MAPEPYVCTLGAASQKKAFEELHEDPKNRQGAIDTFREWILQQKHIKCPTDNVFLLAFLRAKKFSQLEARKLLEKFLHRRDKMPQWFKDADTMSENLRAALDDGPDLVIPGRDKEGRKIVILRPGKVNVSFKRYKKDDLFKLYATVLDFMHLCDEEIQVNGTVNIFDFSGFTLGHQTRISVDDTRNFMQTWQKNYPARLKQVHVYNAGPFMEFIMMVVKLAMSEKIQKRVTIHTRGLETLYKHIPMELLPQEYLPDDYDGPTVGSERSIIDNLKRELAAPAIKDRLKFLTRSEFSIDFKQKDKSVPQESFRKLVVD